MRHISTKPHKDEQGIALVLSMMVLAAIFGLVIAVSDTSFSILKSNQSIGLSEVALFAAESAAEITIYDIEANGFGLDLVDLTGQTMSDVNATWSREVKTATTTPGLCGAQLAKPVCSTAAGAITTGNGLQINLENGETFQMELNLLTALYPDSVDLAFDIAVKGSRVVVHGAGTQVEYTSGTITIPSAGVLDPADGYVFKIINESGSDQQYDITTNVSTGPDELPLGLDIIATGSFLSTERTIQLTRPAWLIY